MTDIKEWNELTLYEKIRWLPERHPYVVKCALFLSFNVSPVPWEFIYKVLERMGYISVSDEEDLGNGMVRVTKNWTTPEGL